MLQYTIVQEFLLQVSELEIPESDAINSRPCTLYAGLLTTTPNTVALSVTDVRPAKERGRLFYLWYGQADGTFNESNVYQ